MRNLFVETGATLAEADVDAKIQRTHDIARQWQRNVYLLDHDAPLLSVRAAGSPDRPRVVHPRELPKRGLGTQKGRIAMMHAVAHIEFNAINLALDAVHRFRDMPREYYRDWLRVADEEARHFSMVRDYLRECNHDYGDFDAHNGLWEMAEKTTADVLERMALVLGLPFTHKSLSRILPDGSGQDVVRRQWFVPLASAATQVWPVWKDSLWASR